ncbi:MAG: glycosyltransferase family 4 protein, partial [Chloroflexi bacterium]|nr:glycosyltransferase family 4 protein [Chloroflexota bacterium]
GRMEPYKVMRWIVPDPHVTWAVSAYRAARRLVRQYCPEVVMTTTPPHSAQLVGLWLKRATGLPWVADLRDPWTQNPFVVYPTRWHLKADEVWEKQIFQKADYVVSVTEAMTKQFQGLYAGDIARKICTITNGFDPQDFIGEVTESSLDTRLRIVYTGSLYGLNKPDSFLFCIDRLTKEGKIPAERLCVEFIGLDGIGTLKRYADQSWFRHITPQSHHYAVSSMLSASVLLLLLPSELPYAHSGKLFEYLRASRPILALAPIDSEAACLVRAAKAGVVVPPDDPEAISTAVLRMYDEWQSGQLQVAPDPKVVASFDCRRLTQELVNILDWSAGAADSGKDHKVAAQVSR